MLAKMLLAGILCACYMQLAAQTVSVSVNDSTNVQDSIKSVQRKEEQILSKYNQFQDRSFRVPSSTLADSIEQKSTALKKEIPSERQIKTLRDSLEKKAGFKLPSQRLPGNGLSESELIEQINLKFPEYPRINSAERLSEIGKDSLSSLANKLPSTEFPSLLPEDILKLSPLSGSTIDTKYLKYIDSLRAINLKQEKLKLEEKALSEKSKLVNLKAKPTFRQRSYFEGILGLMSGKSVTLYQASPALGYHFADFFSLGAGPSLHVQSANDEVTINATIRAFSKVEFFKRQLYVQVEDSFDPYTKTAESDTMNKHSVFVGGGVLLSMKSPVTLNFSLMYRVNDDSLSMTELSPFVFRIGISTIKIQK